MKTTKYILSALLLGTSLTACDDLFEPAQEMISDVEVMYNDPLFAVGLLGNAYILMPYDGTPNSDLATDDAVSNKNDNNYRKMAAGSWSSMNDPMSQWQARNNAIQYINILLENVEKVVWSGDPSINQMFIDLYKGDCYGMRAVQSFYLLRAHAGKTADGRLMGVSILDKSQDGSADFNMSRKTFRECYDAIMADIDEALKYLPESYVSISDASQIPDKYKNIGATMSGYNRAFGSHHHGQVNAQILRSLRAQLSLLAASPAYSESGVTWEEAAKAAAAAIGNKKVVSKANGYLSDGHLWYANKDEIESVKRTENTEEAIWMTNPGESNSLESDNYPPSIYGNGRTNPTQNLVDAFPMANGRPITDSQSGYNANDPYAGRDPRLYAYIVLDNTTLGPNEKLIQSGLYSQGSDESTHNLDVTDDEFEKSTRTGYYLRKLLREDVNMDPNTTTTLKHYTARIRWTEMFLAFAEAANEAYGPTSNVAGTSYTAKSVIRDIRKRAGIGVDETGKDLGDPYLDECAQSKDKMRELIRNERRLELCFENQRFYDIRRWNLDLNVTVKGMKIDKPGQYETYDVETRNFKDYMIYGPIPYSEIMKYSNLEQNKGW